MDTAWTQPGLTDITGFLSSGFQTVPRMKPLKRMGGTGGTEVACPAKLPCSSPSSSNPDSMAPSEPRRSYWLQPSAVILGVTIQYINQTKALVRIKGGAIDNRHNVERSRQNRGWPTHEIYAFRD